MLRTLVLQHCVVDCVCLLLKLGPGSSQCTGISQLLATFPVNHFWCSALLAWCEPSGCFVLLILSSTTEPPAFVCKELSLKLTQCITGTAMHGDQPRYVTTSDVWLPLGSYLRKLQAISGREVHVLQLHCLCQILLAINNALQAPHPHKILNCCCMHCCKLSCW